MLEIMILYVIWEYELTMYYISKKIHEVFGEFSKPSFGAIKPALVKLEKEGFIKSRKTFSDGGKLTGHYSITPLGKKAFKNMMMEDLSLNPIQFKANASIKLMAVQKLSQDVQQDIFEKIFENVEILKLNAEKHRSKISNPLEIMVIENIISDYEIYLKLIDKLKKL
jgi:DNA-binding PadR family transcriptional regulator